MAHQPIIYGGKANTGVDPLAPGLSAFGPIGRIYAVTIHHSAGPRAKTKAQAIKLNTAYNQQHANQGWGGIGYHFSVDDLGRIYRLRPVQYKGAHTGGHNTGNVGIMFHGNYDLEGLTAKQRATLKWLFQGGLLKLTGRREQDIALVRGHQEWPGPTNSTACPGRNLMRHLRWRRSKDLH